jgi:hypothetical protein
MSVSEDALEQSKRLLEKRESDQAEFEARVRESKKALARSEKMLADLKDTIARAMSRRKGDS